MNKVKSAFPRLVAFEIALDSAAGEDCMVDRQDGKLTVQLAVNEIEHPALNEAVEIELKNRGFSEHEISVVRQATEFAMTDSLMLLALKARIRRVL